MCSVARFPQYTAELSAAIGDNVPPIVIHGRAGERSEAGADPWIHAVTERKTAGGRGSGMARNSTQAPSAFYTGICIEGVGRDLNAWILGSPAARCARLLARE
ncbi:hypothetical protein MesoLjLb_10790 [Mesorhizobium sp. L-8-3]|nr:hypothetical protein MesoLjLb_10790 [Mesorhizobium sp. L-8-3]